MFSEANGDEKVEIIINDIFELYGYDFTGYSRASLKRRMQRLYSIDKLSSFAEYRYKIRNEVEYFHRFLENITVNFTEMFRDAAFYRDLRTKVMPVLATYPFIRIWVAGCSTGEEAYSLSILLKEHGLLHKSLIYATDINTAVLQKASRAMFPLEKMKIYSENYMSAGGEADFSSYYTANYSLAAFNEELRSKIIFSTHNLATDQSFNEFLLILCRNVLIYFDRPLQERALKLFDGSLENLGFIALGTKETLEFSFLKTYYSRLSPSKIWRKLSYA